jgi:acyl-CoA thioester hydrolase
MGYIFSNAQNGRYLITGWQEDFLIFTGEKVRFADTDMMGIAHHANYFLWLEAARVEYLRAAGVELTALLADGFSFPISEASCHYRKPAHYGDVLRISVTMEKLSRARMEFSYKIEREGALLAEGHTVNAFTGTGGGVVRLPDKYYLPLRTFRERDGAAS